MAAAQLIGKVLVVYALRRRDPFFRRIIRQQLMRSDASQRPTFRCAPSCCMVSINSAKASRGISLLSMELRDKLEARRF